MPVPLPRLAAPRHLGQIERHGDADQAAADALQKAAEHQGLHTRRESA